MKRIILFIIFTLPFISVMPQDFSEILGRPTNKSVTINAVFNSQADVYFEYGTTKGIYPYHTDTTTVMANDAVEKVFQGLTADSRYYYRTRYRLAGSSGFSAGNEHTFITQRPKGSSFVFTIEADPHPYDKKGYLPLWDICLQNQLNDAPDFMFDLGDTFGDDHLATTITSDGVKQLMLNNRPHLGLVCHSMPFFFCEGNHEGESGYYLLQTPPDNMATYETLWRKRYYPNPFPDDFYSGNTSFEDYGMGQPENYYSFEWGDALFVVIDAWRYYTASVKPRNWDWTIGKTQYDWLKQTLETSTAKYKFVFCHHVMGETRGGIAVATGFEWGGMDNGTNKFAINRPGWAMPIHQLMVANHVNIFFQGHDHLYARESLDSLVYQEVPMPADSSYSLGYIANAGAYTGVVLNGTGHLRVTVNTDSVKVDYISSKLPKDETTLSRNGDILYSYSVRNSTINGLNNVSLKSEPACSIYPTNSKNEFNVLFNQSCAIGTTVRVSDLNGRMINQYQLNKTVVIGETKTFSLAANNATSTAPGMYIISVFSDCFSYSDKLLMLNE